MKQTDDLRINAIKELSPPALIHEELPISERAADTVYEARKQIHRILHDEDDRLLVIIGPCSVHDPKAALEYAQRLQPVRERLKADLEVVMRVYFEKPRTTVGWKGLINDPTLDDRFEINSGLRLARKLLLDINNLGVPAGTEYLDLISPQYIADLISWGAIGARTTESQAHRELASGLSCPVGFKNATNGSMRVALDAIRSSSRPHHFLSVTKEGRSAIFSTHGNQDCHIILRGGSRPNYDSESINIAAEEMESNGLKPRLMVDFSHANSRKQHPRQLLVGRDVASQIARGDQRIMGAMIESFLVEGRQDRIEGEALTYGQSITDACISWEDSEPLLETLADAVRKRRNSAEAA
ncbi:MAG: 3-deoxy-7-phosphoheptulonate synthase [gamma proteobacterium symbiont of Ctena orbiculata]|uniref:Phospho-2-dehydro-3-deoxyheptonate aldolase n=1 Tax=Candidatus Thiodiazotropha taylori TaxID=2792791 RepID=A0A944QSD9_9GAMM|nr:3-deoxy-7-phosphoheptulonate synthase AroG [Candidatus Thiodiazotropha taylori]PUB86571.1 MAG: 3-deoxy-7-phosphoheptulonate synthase [gamma proteobacterium symbiont of Ctena orbiculata]MBT2987932.1 3-deoxy-7-phosphoheptulonate synthase AroG [Candidatus Thiodiazotropha taylori]MBT2997577.1 3-deoxy-7-phosphoheptulonate synthase AroG [Candidatus Thiodiazotropha taylori]MBT2998997.1 3-deoxy-7-phosphoheptulonate synthase AroG [Candidatus Thiodiazotropha taylori]